MHTSWLQFRQNHQVPVGVNPLLPISAAETKSTNVKSAKLLTMCDRDHYLDAKWKLRIGTDFVIVGHGSYWSSHGELLVWFPFCPFWFAVSIYNLSFFYFSYLLQKIDIIRQNILLRLFFCMPPSTWTAWPSQQYEDWVWWYLRISKCMDFSCPCEERVSFVIPHKHLQCHHGQHQKHW